MTIQDIFEELNIHFKRIDALIPQVNQYLPLNEDDFENTEIVKTLDSFIYRFIKVQDRMGEKLFPEYLKDLQEYKPNMPLIDMLNTLERIEVINSTEDWIDYRKLRNNLTHEYPGNEKEIIDSLNSALEAYGNIKNIYKNIIKDVSKRNS
ncbi:MAG: hypothetical protein K9G63_17260 [Melioribacteraceae bacterium]|nr:hypothetical protein [Melioribacteraceae bacterium]